MISIRDVAFIKIPDSFATASVRLTDTNAVCLSKSGAQGSVISSSWAIPNASHAGLFLTLYQKNQGDLIPVANCNLLAATVSVDAAAPISSIISKLTHPEGIYIAPDQEIWAALSKSADVSVSCALGFYGAAPLPEANILIISTLPVPQSLVSGQRGLLVDSVLPAPQSELLNQLLISGQILSEMSAPQSVVDGQVKITGQIVSGLPVPQSQITQEVRASIDSALPVPQSQVAANLMLMSVASILPVPQSSVSGSLRLASVISALPVPQSSATASLRLGSVVSALPVPQSVITAQPPYKERTITITSGTAYTNYPLLINFNASNALANGADIRVFDNSGNPLTFYREPHSTPASTDIIVNVPSIINGTTTIKIRYGQGETVSVSTTNAISSVLASAVRWLSSSDISVANSTPVDTWTGRIGGSISQATLTKRPIYNSTQKALDFDGVDDIYAFTQSAYSQIAVFTVHQYVGSVPGGENRAFGLGCVPSSFQGRNMEVSGGNFGVVADGFGRSNLLVANTNKNLHRVEVASSSTTAFLNNSGTTYTNETTTTTSLPISTEYGIGGHPSAPTQTYSGAMRVWDYLLLPSIPNSTNIFAIREYFGQKHQLWSNGISVTVGGES